jgi:hypothetical protein
VTSTEVAANAAAADAEEEEVRGLAGELEAAWGDLAERAEFLAVLRRTRRAAAGGPESDAVGLPVAIGEDADANPGSPRVGRRLAEAAREAGRLLGEFERESVWLLLRADSLAAARDEAEAARAKAEAGLARAETARAAAEAALALALAREKAVVVVEGWAATEAAPEEKGTAMERTLGATLQLLRQEDAAQLR